MKPVEELMALAHEWARQSYLKGLGRPCDIDGSRAAFRAHAERMCAPSACPERMTADPMDPGESFEHYAKHEGYVDGWNDCIDAMLSAAPAAPVGAEPVAWMWKYIGPDPIGSQIKPCARAPHEMDPTNPPHPKHWQPLYPLYAHPVAQGKEKQG